MKHLISLLFSISIITSAFSQDNLYWVGGSGSWNDPDHWSLESGGAPANLTPYEITNVFFDENSFIGISENVTIDIHAWCKNMYWIPGETAQPIFIGNENTELHISGSMFLSENMDYQFEGVIEFFSVSGPQEADSIQTAGNTLLGNILFSGIDDSWILVDELTIENSIYLECGSLNTNGKQVECGSFISDYQNLRTLNIQNSTIRLFNEDTFAWLTDGTNLTLIAENSQILLEGETSSFRTHNGSQQVYNDIILNGLADSIVNSNNEVYYGRIFLNGPGGYISGEFSADSVFMNNSYHTLYGASEINVVIIDSEQSNIHGNHNIASLLVNEPFIIDGYSHFGYAKFYKDCTFYGENTFDTLILIPGVGNTYYFEKGKTQTIMDSLYIRGHQCSNITLRSSHPSQLAYIKKDYGDFDVSCDFLVIHGVAAESETLDFYAGANSTGVPDPPPGWIFDNSSGYIFGFNGYTIEGCLGDTVILDASNFNGNDSTLYFWNGSTTPGEITYSVTEPSLVTIHVQYAENCYLYDEVNVVFDTCTNSIQESLVSTIINLYPNPSNGVFTLEIEDNIKEFEFSLWSLKGVMLYSEKIRPTEKVTTRSFDFSHLKKGIYYARFDMDNNIVTKKIIIR